MHAKPRHRQPSASAVSGRLWATLRRGLLAAAALTLAACTAATPEALATPGSAGMAAAGAAAGAGAMAPGVGAAPWLPAPQTSLIPTLHIAKAVGWAPGAMPQPAAGLRVNAFASGLQHPRWLLVLPNGDVLVAETNAPARAQGGGGLRGWIMGLVMASAGAAVPSPDRIVLLRDADGDGVAELRTVFIAGLHSPFGMALVDGWLYVANTDAVLRFAYTPGATTLQGPGEHVADLPAGELNHHWTKNLLASPDGRQLYISVGSNSNVGENGLEREAGRAAIIVLELASGAQRTFASGLRNPNGMAWWPGDKAGAPATLWTVVNERDELGNDLVPDYLTSVKSEAFYGWPYSYFGQHVDARVSSAQPERVAAAIAPDYALGAHVAALGLAMAAAGQLPAPLAQGGALIGEHGSWNRQPRSGYQLVFVPFSAGRPSGPPTQVLGGFVNDHGQAQGRPVGVAITAQRTVLVADDVGNTIWRVTAAQ